MNLSESIINNLPKTEEKIIDSYIIKISAQVKKLSDKYKKEGYSNYHDQARADINKLYGKGWREKLISKKISISGIGKMSYY